MTTIGTDDPFTTVNGDEGTGTSRAVTVAQLGYLHMNGQRKRARSDLH